jgi:hypothetical protein
MHRLPTLVLTVLLAVTAIGCCDIPSYNPSFWNDGSTVQGSNNCYNYGNNKRTDTYAQPGRASTGTAGTMSCSAVYAAALADGLEAVPASGTCPSGKDKVALVVDPGTDYHWYRLDTGGMWSPKPGGGQATNLDGAGAPISNPETAERCGSWPCYTDFCNYMCSCSDDVEGEGHETIN